MELLRMFIVYPHLIACCVAIGLVLTSDIAMVRRLLTGDRRQRDEARELSQLQTSITVALVALWVSGIAIVSLDASTAGWSYFLNPKLQAKVIVVVVLTLNGVVLHRGVLPAIKQAGSLLRLPAARQRAAALFGMVSGVSWFYAAMLGIARPLSWKYPLGAILAAYPALIVGGYGAVLALIAWSVRRHGSDDWTWLEPGAHSNLLEPLRTVPTRAG